MRLAQYAMQEPCDGPPTFPMRIGINSARRLINFQAQYELRPSPSHPHPWVALKLDAGEWEAEEAAGTPPDQLKGFMVRGFASLLVHHSAESLIAIGGWELQLRIFLEGKKVGLLVGLWTDSTSGMVRSPLGSLIVRRGGTQWCLEPKRWHGL